MDNVKQLSFSKLFDWTQKQFEGIVSESNVFNGETYARSTPKQTSADKNIRYGIQLDNVSQRESGRRSSTFKRTDTMANDVSSYVRDGLRSAWISLEACGQNFKEIAKTAVEDLTSDQRRGCHQSSRFERRKSDSALNVHRIRSRGSRSSEGSMMFHKQTRRTSDGMSALLRSDLYSESSFDIKRELLQGVRSGKITLSGNGGLACQEQGPVGRRATMDSSMRNGKTIPASASFTQKPPKKMLHRSSCPIVICEVKGDQTSSSAIDPSSTSFNNSNKAKSTVGDEEIADGVVTFFDSCPVELEFEPSYWIGLSIRKEPTDGSLRLIIRQTGSLPAIVGTKRFSKLTLSLAVKGNTCGRRFGVTLMKSKRDNRFASKTLSLKGMEKSLNITVHCKLRLIKYIVKKSVVDEWNVSTKTDRSRFHWKQMKGTSDM